MGITWGPPLSAAAPGPLPQQPHRSPLLGISAIKAVGVASSPELGPPLPRSPRGGHCPGLVEGRAARGTASSFQRAAGRAGRGSPEGPAAGSGAQKCPRLSRPRLGARFPQIQDPGVPGHPPLVCNGTSVLLLSRETVLLLRAVRPAPHMTIVRFVSRLSGVGNLLVFFQPSWPYLFRFSQCLQPVR